MKVTDSHEWIDVDDKGVATVGVTDHAQKELGDVVYVELPKVGALVKAGDATAVLESTKAAVDVYVPASGEVVAVNHRLQDEPYLINVSAQSEGWICRLRLTDPQELELLKDL